MLPVMQTDPDTHRFGYRPVAPAEKTRLVQAVFDSVAGHYDIMNDLMSFGIHRIWKRRLVAMAAPRAGEVVVDVAGGTGDVAIAMSRLSDRGARVTALDINQRMLQIGQARAIDQGLGKDVQWVVADARSLPLPSSSVDLYTIAFGLRNVVGIDQALAEAARVLRPGGRFLCLEFSRLRLQCLSPLYDGWSFGILPMMGQVVAGDADAYRYLAESIRTFPDQEQLGRRMEGAGLSLVRWSNLSAGVAAIHRARRL